MTGKQIKLPGLVGQTYQLQNTSFESQRTINMYPVIDETQIGNDEEIQCMDERPGLTRAINGVELFGGPCRGGYTTSNGRAFLVVGVSLLEVTLVGITDGVPEFDFQDWGELNSDEGFVSMNDNGAYLVIVDGPDGYSFSLTSEFGPINTFAQISDDAFQGANIIAQIDSYLVFNEPGSNRFYWSQPLPSDLEFNGLDFEAKSGAQDPIVGLASDQLNLWVFGSQTSEIWANSPTGNATFVRIPGPFIERGCASVSSIQNTNEGIFLITQDTRGLLQVVRTYGQDFERLSTLAIELQLQQFVSRGGDLSTVSANSYMMNGHLFYTINLHNPDADPTELSTSFTLDFTTTKLTGKPTWHERTYTENGLQSRHIAQYHALLNGYNLVGDYREGAPYIYYYDVNNHTDDGAVLTRSRTTPFLSNKLNRLFYHMFQLEGMVGVGTITDEFGKRFPRVMLEYSDMGSNVWSNVLYAELGGIGDYQNLVQWWQLGEGRNRLWRITCTDPVKFMIYGAILSVESGGM